VTSPDDIKNTIIGKVKFEIYSEEMIERKVKQSLKYQQGLSAYK